jgi:hypothetical protein
MNVFKNIHHGMDCILMEEYDEFDLCMTKKLMKGMMENVINHY